MIPQWEVAVRHSRTGALADRVYPGSFDWSTSLLGDGRATITFQDRDAAQRLPKDPHELFQPNARAIDLRWGSFVAFFGKIESWEEDLDTGIITVKAVEFANEWKWRMTYGVANYQDGTLTVQGRSHSGAVARILQRFMNWGPGWLYPIDLPADAPGTFTDPGWQFWRKLRISDLLTQIRQQGYEVYLRPYVTETGETRLQTRVAKRVTLSPSSFKLPADKTPLAGIRYRVDGSRQLTGVQALGNGSGEIQETAYAWAMPGEDIPFRDAKVDFPDLVGAPLQEAATEALTADRNAVRQWSVGEFICSEKWGPEHAAVGRVWQIETNKYGRIPDGVHSLRVIRAAGTLGTVIKTEVQNAAA